MTDWQPGDPLYAEPAIRHPMVTIRGWPDNQLGIDAASWPEPAGGDEL